MSVLCVRFLAVFVCLCSWSDRYGCEIHGNRIWMHSEHDDTMELCKAKNIQTKWSVFVYFYLCTVWFKTQNFSIILKKIQNFEFFVVVEELFIKVLSDFEMANSRMVGHTTKFRFSHSWMAPWPSPLPCMWVLFVQSLAAPLCAIHDRTYLEKRLILVQH